MTVAELPPKFGWVVANRQDRVIPPEILRNAKKRAKFIRSVFAFPFGHTFAWEDSDLQVDDRDRVLIEWGMFQGLSIASRRVYASSITIYLRWADAVKCTNPWPLTETRAALFAAWRLRDSGVQVQTIKNNFTHLQDFHNNLGNAHMGLDGISPSETNVPRVDGILRSPEQETTQTMVV